jgi:hypothetical protein
MKTLRNTAIIAVVVTSLGFVNVFAQKKVEKVKAHLLIDKVTAVSDEAKSQSDESLRNILLDVLNQASINESGRVNIIFSVTPEKHLEILNVFGTNQALVIAVKYELANKTIMVPDAVEGKYFIPVVF